MIRVFGLVNYLVRTSAGVTWKRHVNQLVGLNYSYVADSILPSDMSSSIKVLMTTFRLPAPLFVDPDVQGSDSSMDGPPVSVATGLVSGEGSPPD